MVINIMDLDEIISKREKAISNFLFDFIEIAQSLNKEGLNIYLCKYCSSLLYYVDPSNILDAIYFGALKVSMIESVAVQHYNSLHKPSDPTITNTFQTGYKEIVTKYKEMI